jgi:CheY-like chemotaxis protein
MTARPRIVIATPDRAECELIAGWLLAEGFEPVRAVTLHEAADEIQARSFDLLVVDLSFAFRGGLHAISRGRTRSPHTPSLIIGDSQQASHAAADRHHTMYLERPIDRGALVCMVSMVIMENRPVRRSPRKRVPRLEAMLDGLTCALVEVSPEGLRLEIPRGRSASPPYFNLRVPMIGVSLTVQRIWTSISSDAAGNQVNFCGGAIADNPPRATAAWRTFVDALPVTGGRPSAIVQVG